MSPKEPVRAGGDLATKVFYAFVVLCIAGVIASAVMIAVSRAQTRSTPIPPIEEETHSYITLATAPLGSAPWKPPVFTDRQTEREAMVNHIYEYYAVRDTATLEALSTVPRHEFVPKEITAQSYDDTPLPIANGQLISQPWIVASMTMNLQLKPDSKVLEIGTGSGYQAAVLSHLTPNVYSIEIIKPLAEAAAERLRRLGYDTINLRVADGFYGWPDAAPFDAIIVTCAAGQIPPLLLNQLKPGGRMMIPVGQPFATQNLILVKKEMDGSIKSSDLGIVRFVPLLQKDPTADK